jgi:two-component system, NtrC family, response regulator GlrR
MATGQRDTTLILQAEPAPPKAGAWLIVEQSGQPSRSIEIGSTPLLVGSGSDCTVILNDPHVSNRHVELVRSSAGVVVRDLGSRNGTRVANIAVKEVVLSSEAEITVGTTKLRLDLGGELSELGDLGRLAQEPVRDDELSGVPARFGGAVGSSATMRKLFALLGRLAPSNLTVTLLGETGTGKDVLAHAIHNVSPRSGGPFVVFDCAAAQPSLIESELFGHERGAFTGAVSARVGVFERAHRGTLFIDEIGEMPLDLQPKLLRALEDRKVRRLGGSGERPFDVRIVAATNRDLGKQVESGSFRQDLYFRLSTAILRVPPLRDHLDDIPDLVAHFLAQEKTSLSVTPSALASLCDHPWPGNVRELKNVIHTAAALANGKELDVKDLVFFEATGAATPPAAPTSAGAAAAFQSLKEQEKAAIQNALQAHGGNRTHAARSLGIAISTLYTKIKKYCLDDSDAD